MIVEKKFFIFIDSLLGKTVKLSREEKVESIFVRKAIIPKFIYDIEIDDEKYPRISFNKLSLLQITSDRKIYGPGENARIIVVNLGRPEEKVDIYVYRDNNLFFSEKLSIDEFGTAFTEISDLETGKYRVEAKYMDEKAITEFTVTPFRLPLIQAFFKKYFLERNILKADVEVYRLNMPYTGECRVGLYCKYCDKIVLEKDVLFKNGLANIELDFSGHSGPFTLYLTLKDGSSTSIMVPHTGITERRKIVLSSYGKIFSATLTPIKNARKIRGLYIFEDGVSSQPIIIDRIYDKNIRIKVLEKFDILKIGLYNPLDKKYVLKEFKNVDENSELIFKGFNPLTFIVIGGFLNKNVFEATAVSIYPEDIEVELSCPEHVYPGGEFKIKFRSNKRIHGVLLIHDSRIAHESIVSKLAKNVFNAISDFKQLVKTIYRGIGFPRGVGIGRGFTLLARPSLAMPSPPAAAREAVEVEEMRVEYRGLEKFFTFFDEFVFEGDFERNIRIGRQPGTYMVKFYGFNGTDFIEKDFRIEASKPAMVEVDIPSFIDVDENVWGRVSYTVFGKGRLYIETPWGRHVKTVEGTGIERFLIKGPGKIKVIVEKDGFIDAVEGEIKKPGLEKLVFSNIFLLRNGEEVEGKRIVVYPSSMSLARDVVEKLVQYPFGCAEQTSSKLAGLGIILRSIRNNLIDMDVKRVEKLIKIGIGRMKKFYKDGLFSLWEESSPSVNVTIKVLENLRPMYGLGFKEIDEMVDKCVSTLLEKNVRDNDLLFYDKRFLSDIKCIEDAVNIYLHVEELKKKALKYILDNMVSLNGQVYWSADKSWAGNIEATCKALKPIYMEGYMDVFRKGFKYISSKIVNGMLYTTSDTKAFIELLSILKPSHKVKISVNGKMMDVKDTLVVKGRVKALSENVLAKIDFEKTVNLFDVKGKMRYSINIDKTSLNIGERASITLIVEEKDSVPIAKIWLPANIVAIEGGANIQLIHTPVKYGRVNIIVIGVRKGRSKLRSLVYDMYNSEKIGITLPIDISVN